MYGIVKCLPTSRRKSSIAMLPEPVVVVHDPSRRRTRAEVKEPLELDPDGGRVGDDLRPTQEVPLGGLPGRIADHPGPAAHDDDRSPAVALDVDETEDRHEVADVERRAARVEPVVGGDRPFLGQPRREPGGLVLEEAPPGELGQQAGRIRGSLERARHSFWIRAV